MIVKDDGAVPDNTKRIAQELIVNHKVSFLAGISLTPELARLFEAKGLSVPFGR